MKIFNLLIFILSFCYVQVNAQYTCKVRPNAQSEATSSYRNGITLNEIMACSNASFDVAFHFQANANGDNFTCDNNDPVLDLPNSSWLMFAPSFANLVIREMNDVMSDALFINNQEHDAKVRFRAVNGGGCNSIFFYGANETIQNLPNAINLRFINDPDAGIRAWTWTGANQIIIENVLASFLNGSVNTWDLGRIINHEFGHTRGLKHAFNCANPCDGVDLIKEDECCGVCKVSDFEPGGCWGCSDKDLMMSYGTQLHLTACELQEMWGYMINNPEPYQSLVECDCSMQGSWVYGGSGNLYTFNTTSSYYNKVKMVCNSADQFTWTQTYGPNVYDYCATADCSQLYFYLNPGQLIRYEARAFANGIEIDKRGYMFMRSNNGYYYSQSNEIFNGLEPEIYPNPASSHINIELPFVEEGRMEIVRFTGQQVWQKEILDSDKKTVDISLFENGVYLLVIYNRDGTVISNKKFSVLK